MHNGFNNLVLESFTIYLVVNTQQKPTKTKRKSDKTRTSKRNMLLPRCLGGANKYHFARRPIFCIQAPFNNLLEAYYLHEYIFHLQKYFGYYPSGKLNTY